VTQGTKTSSSRHFPENLSQLNPSAQRTSSYWHTPFKQKSVMQRFPSSHGAGQAGVPLDALEDNLVGCVVGFVVCSKITMNQSRKF
jgi:hypothetical protein